jgi:hypothetical protein
MDDAVTAAPSLPPDTQNNAAAAVPILGHDNQHPTPSVEDGHYRSTDVDRLSPQLASGELVDCILEGDTSWCSKDRNPAIWIRMGNSDEYTGPSSGLSSLSTLGRDWLQNNVEGAAALCETIVDVTSGIFNHIRQPKCIPWVDSDPALSPFRLKALPPQ